MAAIARLIRQDALFVDSKTGTLHRPNDRSPAGASLLHGAVWSAVKGDAGQTLDKVRVKVSAQLAPIRQRLQTMGLLVDESRMEIARLPLLLVLLVPLFGAVKILVGISRDKPVTILVLMCVISAGVAFRAFWPIHRSRRGDRVLARLKEANGALQYHARSWTRDLAGDDLVLALGLFGMGVLADGPMWQLQTNLQRRAHSGDGGGGGCGGGGCGGCGGCGGS